LAVWEETGVFQHPQAITRNIKRRPDAVGFGCDAELYRKGCAQ
jgi:hypothetical protein